MRSLCCPIVALSQQLRNAQKELERRRRMAGITPRTSIAAPATDWPANLCPPQTAVSPTLSSSSLHQPQKQTIKLYPTLATTMLKHDLAAPGRVYWLLRFLDQAGRGWLHVKDIRTHLTKKAAPLRICGWRRLRQLFHQGEGVLWQRDGNGRLWLHGAAKVAEKLESGRLRGAAVELPVNTLLGGIQTVRANFYATFHSGRKSDNPISRDTLQTLTSVPRRTQLEYDRIAHVIRRRNIAIGERYSEQALEEGVWRNGRSAFHFYDSQGQQGEARRAYVAWHLPNSYTGPHRRATKGRQKKINRHLVDLVETGVQGNHQPPIDRLFYPHGAAAGRKRNTATDAYWPSGKTQIKPYHLWQVFKKE